MSHIPIYLLLFYLLDSAVFKAAPLCSTMYNKMLRFPASVVLHQRTQSTQPWPSAHVSVYIWCFFIPLWLQSGPFLEPCKDSEEQDTKESNISSSLCATESTRQFPHQQNMDNRKPASSNHRKDWEVFSVVPNRELNAKYLISKGCLNIHTCLSRKYSVCRLQRTA